MSNIKGRKQLPVPGNMAPQKAKKLPPLPSGGDEGAPPPLPSRHGVQRPPPKLPTRNPLDSVTSEEEEYADTEDPQDQEEYADVEPIQEEYADCEPVTASDWPEEEYNECEIKPEPTEPVDDQEDYDEFEGVAEPSQHEEETYDEFQDTPSSTYEIEDSQETYECVEDSGPKPPALPPSRRLPPTPKPPSPPAPAPPPLPPTIKREKKPEPAKTAPKPPIAAKNPAVVDIKDILAKKNMLKKTTTNISQEKKEEPKEYVETKEVGKIFQQFQQKVDPNCKKQFRSSRGSLDKEDSVDEPKSPAKLSTPAKGMPLPVIPSEDSKPALPQRPSEKLPPPPPISTDDGKTEDFPAPPSDITPTTPPKNFTPPPPTKSPEKKVQPYTHVQPNAPEFISSVSNGNQEDSYDDQEIYDEAFSNFDPLIKFSWYFNVIERDDGNSKLRNIGENGAFLVRKSSSGGENQPCTLMVYYNKYVYNLKIRRRTKDYRFALGEYKDDELSFESVEALIEHHKKENVILVHKSGKQYFTVLAKCPSK